MLWRLLLPLWLVISLGLGAFAPRPQSPELAYRLGVSLSYFTWGTLIVALLMKLALHLTNQLARRAERRHGWPADLLIYQNRTVEGAALPMLLVMSTTAQILAIVAASGRVVHLGLVLYLTLPILALYLSVYQFFVRYPNTLRLPTGVQAEGLNWKSRARAGLLLVLGLMLLVPLCGGIGPAHVSFFALVTIGLWLLGAAAIDLIYKLL